MISQYLLPPVSPSLFVTSLLSSLPHDSLPTPQQPLLYIATRGRLLKGRWDSPTPPQTFQGLSPPLDCVRFHDGLGSLMGPVFLDFFPSSPLSSPSLLGQLPRSSFTAYETGQAGSHLRHFVPAVSLA